MFFLIKGLVLICLVGGSCKERANSCGECISESYECKWCQDADFSGVSRCVDSTLKTGKMKSGKCKSFIDPKSKIKTQKSRSTRDSGMKKHKKKHKSHNQHKKAKKQKSQTCSSSAANSCSNGLNPYDISKVDITLRTNDEAEFDWQFSMPPFQPIDLYFVFDLSFSMKPDLEKLQQYSSVLFEKFWCLFPDEEKESFHVGIGTFIDKRLSPAMSENDALQHNPCLTEEGIGKCKPNYVFKNNVQLTSDTDEFKKELEKIVKDGFSSNIDVNEAGLDALIQSAVCEDIGWREGTRKMIVYASDAGFHSQGDGFFNGLLLRHDEKCHLDIHGIERDGNKYDYPSMAQTASILNQENIMVAFSVTQDSAMKEATEHMARSYDDLSDLVTTSKVVVVDETKTNEEIANLIFDLYKELAYRSIVQMPSAESFNLEIEEAIVRDENGDEIDDCEEKSECENIKPCYTVDYKMKIRHLKTGTRETSISDEIIVEAVKPNHIDINVNLLETCDNCAKNDSFDCGGRRNTFECGVCKCDMGTDEDPNLNRDCQRMGDNNNKFYSLPCNGAGSCRCGKCFCNENRIGEQCQCNSLFCGMNGKCGNGKCVHEIDSDTGSCKMSCDCEPGFTIDRTTKMCSCSTETENCKSENGKQCGGKKQGHCNCNKCECNELYTIFDETETNIGAFDDQNMCSSIIPSCPDLTGDKSPILEELKIRLSACRMDPTDDETCFVNADTEFNFEGEVISKSYIMKDEKNLGQFSKFEFSTIRSNDDQVASVVCEVVFDDPKEEHDRCVGHFNLIFSGNKIGYELFLETDDPDQKFKYYKCTTNMAGTIVMASVGTACALAIIISAIGLYCFDKYLKRKEVTDHEKEVKLNDTYTTNPLSISGVETYNADQPSATENDTLLRQASMSQPMSQSMSQQPYQANAATPNPIPRQRNAASIDKYGSRQPDGTIMADQTLGADPNTTLSRSFNYNN